MRYVRDKGEKFLDVSVKFLSIPLIAAHQYKSDQHCQTSWEFCIASEDIDTEDSVDSLDELISLDDDFAGMHFEPASSDDEVADNEVESNV